MPSNRSHHSTSEPQRKQCSVAERLYIDCKTSKAEVTSKMTPAQAQPVHSASPSSTAVGGKTTDPDTARKTKTRFMRWWFPDSAKFTHEFIHEATMWVCGLMLLLAIASFASGSMSLHGCEENYFLNNGLAVGVFMMVSIGQNMFLVRDTKLESKVSVIIWVVANAMLIGFTGLVGMVAGAYGVYCESHGWTKLDQKYPLHTAIFMHEHEDEDDSTNIWLYSDDRCYSAYFQWDKCNLKIKPFQMHTCFYFVSNRHHYIFVNCLLMVPSMLALFIHVYMVYMGARWYAVAKSANWRVGRHSLGKSISATGHTEQPLKEVATSQEKVVLKLVPSKENQQSGVTELTVDFADSAGAPPPDGVIATSRKVDIAMAATPVALEDLNPIEAAQRPVDQAAFGAAPLAKYDAAAFELAVGVPHLLKLSPAVKRNKADKQPSDTMSASTTVRGDKTVDKPSEIRSFEPSLSRESEIEHKMKLKRRDGGTDVANSALEDPRALLGISTGSLREFKVVPVSAQGAVDSSSVITMASDDKQQQLLHRARCPSPPQHIVQFTALVPVELNVCVMSSDCRYNSAAVITTLTDWTSFSSTECNDKIDSTQVLSNASSSTATESQSFLIQDCFEDIVISSPLTPCASMDITLPENNATVFNK